MKNHKISTYLASAISAFTLLLFTFPVSTLKAQIGNGARAAYSTRKIVSTYSGPALQVRRSCDNLTADIGFTACGDLDTNALKAHVFGAPPMGSGSGTAMSYALRKLLCGYSGNAIRVRRSCDNTETDIGFTSNGDLDTVALKNFVFGAGPLNMISTSANVAYSLRRMRCAYSGFAIRVRRSSDNATQDIGFTTSGDLDVTALLAFVGAGNGFVTIWYDQSGNGKNLSQANAANQPQIVAAGSVLLQNGKPTVRFTASSAQTLRFAGTISSGSGAFSLFAISSRTNATLTAGSEIFGWGANSNIGSRIGLWNDINTGRNSLELLSRAKIGNSTTAGALDLKTWIYTSGNISTGLTGFYNGSTITTTLFGGLDVTPNVTGTEICMGAVPTTNAHPFDGNVSEVIGFTAALNTTERQILEYLQSIYYNISGPSVVSIGSTSADAYVTTWYDQSGSARNATQTTVASQPRIMNDRKIDRINGKPTIVFDGVNDYFTHNNFPTAGFTGFTANMLVRWNTTGSSISTIRALMDNDHRCPSGSTSGLGFIVQDRPDFTNKPVTFAAPNSTSCNSLSDNATTGNGSLRLLTFVNNGSSETIFRDGSQTGTQAYSGSYIPQSRFVIGAWWNLGSVSRFMNGSMSEMTIFPLGLNTVDRKILEYNQAVYYGITGPTTASSTNGPSGYVTTWYDQSGNGNHITQATASRQPVIVRAGSVLRINGRPAMRSSSVLQTNLTVNLPSTYTGTGLLANAVYQTDTTTTNNLRIMSTGNGALFDWNENGLFNINHRGGGSPVLSVERNGIGPSIGITTGTGGIVTASFSGTQRQITGNGTSGGVVGDSRAFGFNKLRLFQSFNNATFEPIEAFTGRMCEYVLFTSAVNDTRRTLLENDQSQYYNISISNERYTPADANYFRNLKGIGRESSTDSVQQVRVSRGFIIEDDAASGSNFLKDNGDYIVAGEECAVAPNTSKTNLSQGVQERWITNWEVKRTDVGTTGGRVRFIFDYSDYFGSSFVPPNTSAASKYVLLKRSTSAGVFDTLNVISKQVVGDRVIFTLDASSINTFFTIGTMDIPLAPLPVDLHSYACRTNDGETAIEWSTSNETGVTHYMIERSADGRAYTKIKTTPARGSGADIYRYSVTDANPLKGINYYRLSEVSENGNTKALGVCASVNQEIGRTTVYPNPANNILVIDLPVNTEAEVTMINQLGLEVMKTRATNELNSFDLSNIQPGIYLVTVRVAESAPQVFKVMIIK